MGSVTFNSPGEMIGGGIGLLILGILLMGIGIGFIGALGGIWWIFKGLKWQFAIWSHTSGNKRTRKNVEIMLKQRQIALNSNNFHKAINISADLSLRFNDITDEFKQQFIRDAAFYSAVIGNYNQANRYNNDRRFKNEADPDFHNVAAIIYYGEGRIEEGRKAYRLAGTFGNKGRFFDIIPKMLTDITRPAY